MTFKNIVRELRGMRDGIGAGMSRRGNERNNDTSSSSNKNSRRRGRSHIAPEGSSASSSQTYEPVDQSIWVGLSPELLLDIIRRIESSQTSWPARRDVVACASVCRSWREITKEVVKTPELCSLLTFPVSLKQPGPRDAPIQCFIRRERATGTYRLYLGLSPALSGDLSKLLLAAKKVRRATSVEFVISLSGNDFSRTSSNYVGKLRSNFLGTKFTVYDGQPPLDPEILSNCKLNRKLKSRQVSPWVSTSNYNIASISYELNVLRTRGPRRMQCVMHSVPFSSVEEGGTAPTPTEFTKSIDSNCHPCLDYKEKKKGKIGFCSGSIRESLLEPNSDRSRHPLVLKNKAPRWHEQLQCWCLNFKGRVTVASVKNFQLVAAAEPGQNIPESEQERVILQFGKIGKDIFTMDYRYPLSVFQAFAICLSSFDTKPACE